MQYVQQIESMVKQNESLVGVMNFANQGANAAQAANGAASAPPIAGQTPAATKTMWSTFKNIKLWTYKRR